MAMWGGGGGGGGEGRVTGSLVQFTACDRLVGLVVKGATPGPRKQPALGKVLFTYLSPLRMERVGRAGALVCLAA